MATASSGAQPPVTAASASKIRLKKQETDYSSPEVIAAIEARRAKAAEALTGLYDKLNQSWATIEERLRGLLPPREAWISYARFDEDYRDPNSGTIHHCIGLVKYRGEWRVCHGRYNDMYDQGPDSWKPIVECSVEERVAAVKGVDKLREEIVSQAERSIPKVDEAAAALAKALERF